MKQKMMNAGGRFGLFSRRRSRCLIKLSLRAPPAWWEPISPNLCLLANILIFFNSLTVGFHMARVLTLWEQNSIKLVFICVGALHQRRVDRSKREKCLLSIDDQLLWASMKLTDLLCKQSWVTGWWTCFHLVIHICCFSLFIQRRCESV